MGDGRPRWYLAVDLGTGGVKVATVHEDGRVLASAFRSIESVQTDDGGTEQDTDEWWSHTSDAICDVLATTSTTDDAAASRCAGVGITGQWGSTVPVDGHGRAVGPCIVWSDHRGGQWSRSIVGSPVKVAGYGAAKALRWLRLSGGLPSPSGADPTGHVHWLQHRRPDVYGAAATFLEPVDFIGLRLTGRAAATPASMTAAWLTDNRPDAALRYHPTLVRLARRDATKLPPLLATGTTLGVVCPDIAAVLGLPADVPVVCGVPDLHTAAIGAGAVADFAGHIAISTTAWVSAPVPFKKTDIVHQMTSVPGLRAGSYLIANNHETGGATLRWLRDSVLGDADYDAMTAEAAAVPAGSGGVIFTPWLKGERSPVADSNLRASFINMSLSTTRAHLIRAVLEGVAYNARWLLEVVDSYAGRPLESLRILGGGAVSDLWCQIHADVIGRPIHQVADPMNVNVRGAAWFAALHLGHIALDDVASRTPPARVFQPSVAAGAAYAPLYAEFTALAKSQRSMFKRLNARH